MENVEKLANFSEFFTKMHVFWETTQSGENSGRLPACQPNSDSLTISSSPNLILSPAFSCFLCTSLKLGQRLPALAETMLTGESPVRLPASHLHPNSWPLPNLFWSLTLPVTIPQPLTEADTHCSTCEKSDHQKSSPQPGWRLPTLPEITQTRRRNYLAISLTQYLPNFNPCPAIF